MENQFEPQTDKEKIEYLERRIQSLESDKRLLRTRCKAGVEEAFDKGMYGVLYIDKIGNSYSELVEDLRHWLAYGIAQNQSWIDGTCEEELSKTMYDGVEVTKKQFDLLAKAHIKFCKVMMENFCNIPHEQIDEVVKRETEY